MSWCYAGMVMIERYQELQCNHCRVCSDDNRDAIMLGGGGGVLDTWRLSPLRSKNGLRPSKSRGMGMD